MLILLMPLKKLTLLQASCYIRDEAMNLKTEDMPDQGYHRSEQIMKNEYVAMFE
jgi:hypothetical protein